MRAAWLVGAVVLLAPGVASAQAGDVEQPAATDDEARGLFLAGQAAYGRADFDAALGHFERAYELSGRAELLFNIGLAAQRARRRERALEAFREYLRLVPDAPNRADVEARIAEVEELVAASPDAPPDGPSDGSSATTVEGDGPGALPWVVIAGSAAVAIGGGVLLVLSGSAVSNVEDAPEGTPWTDVSGSYDSAPLLSTIGVVMLAAGVVGAGVGVVLLSSGGSSTESDAVALRLLPGGVTLGGRF